MSGGRRALTWAEMVPVVEVGLNRAGGNVVERLGGSVPLEVAQHDLVRGEGGEREPGGEEENPYHDEAGAQPSRTSMQM